jgi:hypothetical protein
VRRIVCRAGSSSEEHCCRIWTVGHHISGHMPEGRTWTTVQRFCQMVRKRWQTTLRRRCMRQSKP